MSELKENEQAEHNEQSNEAPENRDKKYPPALRVQRLAAAMIDNLALSVALFPVVMYLNIAEYFENGEPIPFSVVISFQISAFAFFLILNGWLLYRYGQTIGKHFVKIAVATETFQVPDFNRLIALRYLPFFVANAIPIFALIPLIDVLMIFRQDRRCLHDMLARTQVIDIGRRA